MHNIEVLVRWTELKMKKNNDDDEAELKRLLGKEDEGGSPYQNIQAYYDYSPMVLDVDEIARFNRSHDPEYTTLRMKDGEGYVIKYPYADFIELYVEVTGRTVLSCVPADFEPQGNPSINNGAGGNDDTDTGIDGDDINFDDM